jgi:hypothetical protein
MTAEYRYATLSGNWKEESSCRGNKVRLHNKGKKKSIFAV